MDFSKYKKVKEDKNSTTMQSDGGHTITLMHKTMPRIQVEQLKRLKMGDGGRVGIHIPGEKKMADGGDPGEDQPTPAANITINAAPPPQAPPSGVAPTAAETIPYQASREMPNAAGMHGDQNVQFQPTQAPASVPSILSANGTMDPGAVAKDTQRQAELQRDIDIKSGQANQALQQTKINDLAQNAAQISNNYNDVARHTDDYAQYMREHPIDAEHYLKSMGTGQKVATSLGLLLGGFSQGFSGGGNNPASDWLNNQINRDIDSQQRNQAGQHNILGAYQQLYGNSIAANAAAKASLIDLYDQKAKLVTLQLNTPQAWANYMKFRDAAAVERSKSLQDAAVNLSAIPGTGGAGHAGGGGHGGAPQSGGQAPAQQDENHIMVPNASLDSVRYTPKLKEQLPAITEQFNQARQAEKGLQALNELYPKLSGETTKSGWIASHINPNALGVVGAGAGALLAGGAGAAATGGAGAIPAAAWGAGEGAAIGKGGGELLKGALGAIGGQKQVQYENDKKALGKIIAGSVAGAKLTPTAVEEMVEQLTPSYSDNPETTAQKLNILRHFVRQNVDTSLLEDPSVGLVKRPK